MSARIVVLVPSERVRAWVPRLAESLKSQFAQPTVLLRLTSGAGSPRPLCSEALERRLFGTPSHGHTEWFLTQETPAAEGISWSDCLVVNATERDPGTLPVELRKATTLTPIFHGAFALDGLLVPLLGDETPHLGVVVTRDQETSLVYGARLALPDGEVMLRALDTIFARTITFLRGTVDHLLTGKPLPEPSPPPEPRAATPAGLGFWSRRVLDTYLPKLGRQVRKRFIRSEDWCLGYRRINCREEPPNLDLSPASFSLIESDRARFYADPIVFRHGATTALFFEDYDYEAGRGRISHVVLREDGTHEEPAETLTRPYHLSYPFVFSHEGAALMLPETSTNRTVELYEAESFPVRWRLRSVLIKDIEAADATLHFDRGTGLWWMFAVVTEFGSSSYDTLSLFFSHRIEGPWQPHAANPVKVDPLSSRPTGPIVPWKGRLLRPAQDCTRGYGSGLAWCEIKELSPRVFREELVARQLPARKYTGLHTYCRAAGFEAVDFKRDRRRIGF